MKWSQLTSAMALSLILCFFLPSFALAKAEQDVAHDFAIYDANRTVILYSDVKTVDAQRSIEVIETREVTTMDEAFGIWGAPYYSTFGDRYLSKTTASSLDFGDNLILMDPAKPELPIIVRPNDQSNAFTLACDHYTIYAIYDNVRSFTFESYDQELEVLTSRELDKGDLQIAAHQWIVTEDALFLLVGYVYLEDQQANPENVKIHSEIWEMTRDFTIKHKYPLPELEGYSIRFAYDGGLFYITNTIASTDKHSDEPANSIYIYRPDLESQSLVFELAINLRESHPREISYDEANKQLLIYHDPHLTGHPCWTIYSLTTQTETTLSFPAYSETQTTDPFFTIHDGEYYFLFHDKLLIYDPVSKHTFDVDLTTTDLQKPQVLIFQ